MWGICVNDRWYKSRIHGMLLDVLGQRLDVLLEQLLDSLLG